MKQEKEMKTRTVWATFFICFCVAGWIVGIFSIVDSSTPGYTLLPKPGATKVQALQNLVITFPQGKVVTAQSGYMSVYTEVSGVSTQVTALNLNSQTFVYNNNTVTIPVSNLQYFVGGVKYRVRIEETAFNGPTLPKGIQNWSFTMAPALETVISNTFSAYATIVKTALQALRGDHTVDRIFFHTSYGPSKSNTYRDWIFATSSYSSAVMVAYCNSKFVVVAMYEHQKEFLGLPLTTLPYAIGPYFHSANSGLQELVS